MSAVLVTGGAGFIGRHVCACLLERGYRVRALDSLVDQAHRTRTPPSALSSIEAGVESLTAEGRAALDKNCRV